MTPYLNFSVFVIYSICLRVGINMDASSSAAALSNFLYPGKMLRLASTCTASAQFQKDAPSRRESSAQESIDRSDEKSDTTVP